ncbi:MAG: site-specific integrase [Ignavibacteriae bacterium]|nr:site-specific integrase [Ignavibacteriota bacterium]NOG99262.1 site-specific integrase [Ignavibacteriota bacterium]
MNGRIENIAEHYTIDELQKLKVLLEKIEKEKKTVLKSSTTIYKFSQEYKKYINLTFTSSYIKSVVLSLKHLSGFFGEHKLLVELSLKNIEEFKYYLMNRAPKGFVVYMRTLKAAFNIAQEWGYITNNPFQKIKYKTSQNKKPIFITRDELQLVIAKEQSILMRNIYLFAFNTGCRLGEIVTLKWKNIDLENKTITIGDEEFITKSNKQRIIPISSELIKELKKMKKKNVNSKHYVFGKSKTFPYRGEYISRKFKKAIRNAKLKEEVHFHTLRHSFASQLAMKGVPIVVLKELLGHSSITTTAIYSHADIKSLQMAIKHL